MKKTYNYVKSAEKSFGHKDNGETSAKGGYKKTGQGVINVFIWVILFFKWLGVSIDLWAGEVKSGKDTAIDIEVNNLKGYERDLRKAKKGLRKAKKKSDRKSFSEQIVTAKKGLRYYKKEVAKARRL